MREWGTHWHTNMVAQQLTTRYFLREGGNGKRQLSLRNSSELFNAITVMHTWMQRSKMLLMSEEECLCEEFESLINQNHKFLILMLSLLESNLWMYCQLHCSTMSILD
uniref:Uncharacterized protein n=1 Tax=Cannabis sativa TaxID=3483 RepID=A0A803RC90_CANSA